MKVIKQVFEHAGLSIDAVLTCIVSARRDLFVINDVDFVVVVPKHYMPSMVSDFGVVENMKLKKYLSAEDNIIFFTGQAASRSKWLTVQCRDGIWPIDICFSPEESTPSYGAVYDCLLSSEKPPSLRKRDVVAPKEVRIQWCSSLNNYQYHIKILLKLTVYNMTWKTSRGFWGLILKVVQSDEVSFGVVSNVKYHLFCNYFINSFMKIIRDRAHSKATDDEKDQQTVLYKQIEKGILDAGSGCFTGLMIALLKKIHPCFDLPCEGQVRADMASVISRYKQQRKPRFLLGAKPVENANGMSPKASSQ